MRLNLTDTSATKSQIVYGDMSALGLMQPMLTGTVGMTGWGDGTVGNAGSMGGYPIALNITAVPLPAAVWLFGSALVGLLGLGRRQSSVDGGLAA